MKQPSPEIIQTLLTGGGGLFLVQTNCFMRVDTWIISPVIPEDLQHKDLDDVKYRRVCQFLATQCITNIALDIHTPPFQWGLCYESICMIHELSHSVNDFIREARARGITDFHSLVDLDGELSRSANDSAKAQI